MEIIENLKPQERELIFALDIGTRSIIGVLGYVEEERFKVLAIESEEHLKRAMMDGQIEDIGQVAQIAKIVTRRLEIKCGRKLTRVCVAAAGRALRMERATFQMSLPAVRQIDDETINRLEAGAVSAAEAHLNEDREDERRFFLVGYTVVQYHLDRYPMTMLKSHNGKELEAEVVATFLPSEVVESLYEAMQQAGLEVASLTLEPIAALNAAIPSELRLLNLVLADIGAGTSDIAVCREGSVVGYTMATVAGDEITESLMKTFLVDFKTAERLKAEMAQDGKVLSFTDVLGLDQSMTSEELRAATQQTAERLVDEIAVRILEVNGMPPSALFLSGGGSKLTGLCAMLAKRLEMDERRVAVAGNNFRISAFSEEYELDNPAYATPLGIAISAGLGLVNDSYVVMLNGCRAKLFRSGALTVLDILMMNGYTYADLIGRTGKSLSIMINGERKILRGGTAEPSVLRLNGNEAPPSALVNAGDSIEFTPAQHGQSAPNTPIALLGEEFQGIVLVNGKIAALNTELNSGDVLETIIKPTLQASNPQPAKYHIKDKPKDEPDEPDEPITEPMEMPFEQAAPPSHTTLSEDKKEPAPQQDTGVLRLQLNGRSMMLPPKESGAPYYLMDLLHHSGIDFDHLERPVLLQVNGQDGTFTQELHTDDIVSIRLEGS